MGNNYDVAFSFLGRDEHVAKAIGDRLEERYKVFIYSDAQKDLAGKDGIDAFSSVFGKAARVCVVLYRPGWGETPWTRIEETAIKERALIEGWEFLLVLALEGHSHPVWLPRTKLWLGMEAYGIDAAVGAIDCKILDCGGTPTIETPLQQATRIGRQIELQKDRRALLESEAGVDLAKAQVSELFLALERHVESIQSVEGMSAVRYSRRPDLVCAVSSDRLSASFGWSNSYRNSLDGARLIVQTFEGRFHLEGYRGGPPASDEEEYEFTLDDAGSPVWRRDSDDRSFSTGQLADLAIKQIIAAQH